MGRGRKPKNNVAEAKNEMDGRYGEFSEDQLKEEAIRLLKQQSTEKSDAKDRSKASKLLLKEIDAKLDYIVGKIGAIKHEEAVAEVLSKDE